MDSKLTKEILKYKTFYYRTSYCKKEMIKKLDNMKELDDDQYKNIEVTFNSNTLNKEVKVDDSFHDMYVHLVHIDKKLFQQLILTRLISALEVSLIENIMDVFLVNKKIFLNQSKFDITEAEILSTKNIEDIQLKIITNICRNIQSQGLKGIVAFYKKTFNIDIESFNIQIEDKIYNFHYIEMLTDMRHMVVHNLGNLDEKFKRKYEIRGSTVKFTSKEFDLVFEILIKFSDFIDNKIEPFKNPSVAKVEENENIEYKINLSILDDKILNLFQDSFTFKYKNKLCNFYRIKKSIKRIKDIIELRLIGDSKIVSTYISKLKKFEKKGMCKINQLEVFRDFHKSKKTQ